MKQYNLECLAGLDPLSFSAWQAGLCCISVYLSETNEIIFRLVFLLFFLDNLYCDDVSDHTISLHLCCQGGDYSVVVGKTSEDMFRSVCAQGGVQHVHSDNPWGCQLQDSSPGILTSSSGGRAISTSSWLLLLKYSCLFTHSSSVMV